MPPAQRQHFEDEISDCGRGDESGLGKNAPVNAMERKCKHTRHYIHCARNNHDCHNAQKDKQPHEH